MDVGLVEMVDDMRLTNPASNEQLLNAAARFLVESRFDLKALMRAILQSKTYQRSSHPLPENKADTRFYSRYYPRRMMAEVLLDAMSQVTGAATAFADYPAGWRALQLPDSNVDSYFLKTFGRPERVVTCECERTAEPTMVQVLHISNGNSLNDKLQAAGNRLETLLSAGTTDGAIIDDAYLAALSRFPTDAEKGQAPGRAGRGGPGKAAGGRGPVLERPEQHGVLVQSLEDRLPHEHATGHTSRRSERSHREDPGELRIQLLQLPARAGWRTDRGALGRP